GGDGGGRHGDRHRGGGGRGLLRLQLGDARVGAALLLSRPGEPRPRAVRWVVVGGGSGSKPPPARPSGWVGCAGSRGRRLLRPWCRTSLAGGAQMQYRSLCLTCLSNPRQGPACWGLPFSRSEIWGGALARCEPSSVRGDGDAHALVAEAHSGRAAAARLDVGDQLLELGTLHQGEDVGEGVKLEFGAHGVCSPARSSIRSSARTGTRNSLPILTTGISPRAAAS